jgi:hypothetical protein
MYLYSDQTSSDALYGEKTTPAHMYEGTNDFNVILEDIMKGAIPTNTRMVYPTIWKADQQLLEQQGHLANQQVNQHPLMMGFDYRQW